MSAAADCAPPLSAYLAACPHYGVCGGCRPGPPKSTMLPASLAQAGYPDVAIAPIAVSPPHSRRRMDLAARRTPSGVILGLHLHRSHDIVDLAECRVLHPALAALLAPLRAVLARCDLLRRELSVVANLLDSGADLLLRGPASPSTADRTRLAAFAAAHGVVRVSHAHNNAPPEPLAVLAPPIITLSGVPTQPPPGAFLQATSQGEQAIIAAVLAALPRLPPRSRIAEFHAGCGTLTHALAARARVDAYDGNAEALAALDRALRANGTRPGVTPIRRDLAQYPPTQAELKPYACAVLDPPANGAQVLVANLAAAKIATIIYISCNPATLSRDAATLNRAKYAATSVTPIDQFIGTPRLESVTQFQKC